MSLKTKVYLHHGYSIANLIEFLSSENRPGELEIREEKLRISLPSCQFYVGVAIKDVVTLLGLELPSWARFETRVEHIVEKIPKSQTEKCSICEKNISKLREIILLYDGAKILGAFCSDDCENKWRSKRGTYADEAKEAT